MQLGVHFKILTPLLLAVAVVMFVSGTERPTLLVNLGVAVLATWIALEIFVRRPLSKLAHDVNTLGGGQEQGERGDELRRLTVSLSGVRDTVKRMQDKLEHEVKLREQMEAALRDFEQRYDFEVNATTDGRWEWNLKTGEVSYSPRWKAMLGYSEDEIGGSISEWKDRIHPEDVAAASEELQAHLKGATPHYQSDHRLRQKDGSYRWIMSRGSAIRHASGKAYRFVGLNTDISEIKRAQQVLMEMAAGVSSARGEAFFKTLVKSFVMTLGVHRAFVTECVDYPTTRVRIKAYWLGDRFIANKEFELAGTPCEEVVHQGKICLHRTNFSALFPKEAFLGEESYCGMPIFSSSGKVIGHIALYDQKPMNDDFVVEPVFKIFATRAGSEMERVAAENALAIEKNLTRGLLDAVTEGVISTDAQARVAYMNPIAEKMTGVSRVAATGHPLAQVFRVLDADTHQPAHSALLRCLALRVATRDSGAALLLRHDGEKVLVRQWAASFVDSHGAIAGGVLLFNHEGANLEIPLLASLRAA